MAELGAVASVVGIVGFVGQITEGCVYLNRLIGDIKDAPQEVRTLWNEVELVRTVAARLKTIYEQIDQSGTGPPAITNPVD